MDKSSEIALLRKENGALKAEVVLLGERISSLEEKVLLLLEQLSNTGKKKDSRNSHNPPSQDKFPPKRNKSLLKKSGLKSGGQKGHKGRTLLQNPSPDKTDHLKSNYCEQCGEDLREAAHELVSKRQVVELPPIEPIYLEYRQYGTRCSCGHHQKASYPERVNAPIQYGSSVMALVSYLNVYQYVAYQRRTKYTHPIISMLMKTSFTLTLFAIISISFFCCNPQNENNTTQKRYKIEGVKVESASYYFNRFQDTIDISQPVSVEAKIDTNYRLPLKMKPLKLDKVTWFRENVTLAKAPKIIAVEPTMWDTIVHGDTLRVTTKIIKPQIVTASKSPLKEVAPPKVQGNPDYAITALSPDQGSPIFSKSKLINDPKGKIWFITQFGLSKYDGISTVNYSRNGKGFKDGAALLFDNKNDIWIKEYFFLSHFDGTKFEVYDFADLNIFHSYPLITVDKANNIWFYSYSGLSYIKDSTWTHFPDLALQIQREVQSLPTLFCDSNNNIWTGMTWDKLGIGQVKFDGEHMLALSRRIPGVTNIEFAALSTDQEGNIWMLGRLEGQATLVKFDGINFYVYSKEEGFDYPNGPSGNYNDQIQFTTEGEIIVVSFRQGLIKFDGKYFTKIGADQGINNDINSLIEDDAERLWLYSKQVATLYAYNPNKFQQLADIKLDDLGTAKSFFDKSGALWLWKPNSANIFKIVNDSLYEYSLDVNIGSLLFEDEEGGLWFKNRSYATQIKNDSVAVLDMNKQIINAIETDDKQIWFFTWGMIQKLDNQGKTSIDFEGNFLTSQSFGITMDHKGQFWAADRYNCFIKYDGEAIKYYEIPTKGVVDQGIPTNPVEDVYGNIWMITEARGMLKYDGNNFWKYDFSNIMNGQIQSFVLDEKGKFWITTTQDGVAQFDGNYIQFFNTDNGLLGNGTTNIAKDFKDRIWIKTSTGVNVIERIQLDSINNDYYVYSLDKRDGIKGSSLQKGNDFYFNQKSNKVLITNNDFKGLLNLDELQIPKSPPKNLSLAQLDINQQFIDYARLQDSQYLASLDFGEKLNISFSSVPPFLNYPVDLSLPHDLNHLTFHFTASNWAAPHKMRYSFQMEGLDSDWSLPQATPTVDYRNLPHGQHTLLAKVKNESNVWSEPFAYQFSIRPPWWWSWWAYVFYFLLFGAALFGAFSLFKRRLDLRNAYKQEQQEAQRLKELDTFKSRLYTNLTHEFRTPLTVILGMVDQMRAAPKKYFDEGTLLIERNGKNLLRLINQLLDLSRLENKSLQLQMKQSDVVSYLRYVTESFQTYANGQNLSLKFFTNLESLEMDFDTEQLKQIMTNLISNAVKYTPSGGAIQVKITKSDSNLSLQVKDTGVGISEKALPNIFDRFYQVDDSSTRKGEGTGIGLAHTQELVRLMNGSIQVSSTLEEGSTFTVLLPITNKAIKEIPTRPNLKTALDFPILVDTPSVKARSSNEELPQLLIIEDNPDVVTYLKACLEEQYQINVAYNGKIGIEKAIESIPDLIISDVMMPEKNGFEVCHILKNDERTSHIPITLLTAKADMPSKIVGLRRGADAYLSKPFLKEELLVRLEMMIEKQTKLAAYFSKIDQNKVAETVLEESAKIEHEFIQKIRQIVEKHYDDAQFGLPQLCKKIGMSRSQLYRKMKALTHTSPSAFIRSYRLQQAKHLLENTDLNVSEVAWDTGFINLAHFTKAFQEQFGIPPSKVRKGAS